MVFIWRHFIQLKKRTLTKAEGSVSGSRPLEEAKKPEELKKAKKEDTSEF
jgi:hypothetical protein